MARSGGTGLSVQWTWRRIALVPLAMLLGIAVGLTALIGTAAITDRPSLFLLSGLVAFCLVYLLGLMLITRGIDPPRRRRARASVFCAGGAVVVAVFTATALFPLSDPRLPPAPANGQQFWPLSTGSRIAYVRVPAEGDARSTPVIVLHGGPGVPDMKGDAGYFGQLAQDGFDVYVYDQVGRGRSSRLDDPRGYTLERDVADLEAIRDQIGAERVILIGHSSGGLLAAAYAAANPGHVAKMVLSAPEDPAPDAPIMSMVGRLRLREQLAVYALLLQPRALLGYTLLQVNPQAAYAFTGNAEMDARFDRVYNRTRPALHCADKPSGPPLTGLGFYAHYYRQSPASPAHPDFLPALAGQNIPTLVIKGRCDYLTWSSAVSYLTALPDAQLVYLPGAGHNAYQDEPEGFLASVRAFLFGQPLPDPPYTGRLPPGDYEGPP
jgi:proline iminopeptidase